MLRVTLAINRDQIADYEVRRVADSPYAESEHRYEIRPIIDNQGTGDSIGSVWHFEGAGAHRLAALALERIAKSAPPTTRKDTP